MFKRKTNPRQRQDASSTRSPMFSYYAGGVKDDNAASERSNQRQAKPNRNNSLSWWKHIPTIVAGAVILISLIYTLSLSSSPKIIQPSSSENIFLQDINTYEKAAHKLFDQSFLNKNKITVNVSGVTRELQNQFPELESVSITLPLIGHNPIIYINPSMPAVILKSQSGSFVVNDKGIAIIEAYQVKNLGTLKLPTVEDKANISVSLGKGALSTVDINFIKAMYSQFKSKNTEVESFILPGGAEELNVKLKGEPYLIKMNMLGDGREQVGSYLASKEHLAKQNKKPSKYFDVRVEGRVFYK